MLGRRVAQVTPMQLFSVLFLVIRHGCLDGILGQDRTMDLDRRQRQFFGDLRYS
jgi:hypothetical protein